MHLIKVNDLGLQSSQRTFELPPDLYCSIRFRLPVGLRSESILQEWGIDLCCQNDRVTPSATLGKPTTQNLLYNPISVLITINISGVEEVNTKLQRPIHDGKTVFFTGHCSKVHCSKTQVTDQCPVFSQTLVFNCHGLTFLFIQISWITGCKHVWRPQQQPALRRL